MNKKVLKIIGLIVLCGILIIIMTGCGKKKEDNVNVEIEKINIIQDFAKYINNEEIEMAVNLMNITEYDKITRTEISKEQLETILLGINVDFYEINNIKKATEEEIRNIAEEYGTYESFVETYKDYEQYVVDYKLSIDGISVESKDIFFIKEENGKYSFVTSKVWQGLISHNYILMNNTQGEGEQ